MSQGNRKSEGGKGTNYPYQSKVLKGLQQAIVDLETIISHTVNISTLATEATLANIETNANNIDTATQSQARAAGIIRPTAAGNVNTITATFYSVSVANVGSADGTVLGVVIRPGEILNFAADALNNYFTSFVYDATGTEFIITYVY